MWQGSFLFIIDNWGCLTTETCTKIKSALLRTALSLGYKGWNICKTKLSTLPYLRYDWLIQRNLHITKLYIIESSLKPTIFFLPLTVKHVEKNLDITNPRYSEQLLSATGPSLYRCSTVIRYKLEWVITVIYSSVEK